MQKTYIWSLAVALLVVIVGIIVSVMYSTESAPTGTVNNTNPTPTSTVSILKPRDDGSQTVLTPSLSALFGNQNASSTPTIPQVKFSFASPKAGERLVAGNNVALTLALENPNQGIFAMGFELYRADTDTYVASSSLPSIATQGSLMPNVTWNIPHDLPAGRYYILGSANHASMDNKSGVFEVIKNPLSLLASANNMYRQVPVRDRGESVDVAWSTTGAQSCTVGLSNALERNLPGSGKKVIFAKPGETIIISCQDGTYSAMERINVVQK